MNDKLKEFARNEIKEGILKCTEAQQRVFKQAYSYSNMGATIEEIVDNMGEKHLDNAMRLVRKTIENNESSGK